MTIDDVMSLINQRLYGPLAPSPTQDELRAALLALLDAEAEACAELCDKERAAALEVGMSDGAAPTKRAVYATAAAWAATCRDSIRARIAARKGGAQP
jgi:hypothetical protein